MLTLDAATVVDVDSMYSRRATVISEASCIDLMKMNALILYILSLHGINMAPSILKRSVLP